MKDKLVVIHQPDFMPYIGFFDRLLQADIYVVLDNVQYVRGSKDHWTNRDKIKTPKGAEWITINVRKSDFKTDIRDVLLAEEFCWRSKCKNVLYENYRKSAYFDEIHPYVKELFDYPCTHLLDFNLNALHKLNTLLRIDIEVILASDLKPNGRGNDLLVDIMKKLGQTKYLSGTGAKDYYDEQVYKENGIDVVWQDFEHPVYPQQFGDFLPNLSIIDLLYNCGVNGARNILRRENGNGK